MRDSFDRQEFVAGYLAEAEEHLLASNRNLLQTEGALAKGEGAPRQIRELFRSLHTLKGLSAMVGVEPVVQVAHEMETLLRMADQGTLPLSAPAVALLLDGLQAIEQRIRAFAKKQHVPEPPRKLLDSLRALASGRSLATRPAAAQLNLPPEFLAKLTSPEQDQLLRGIQAGLRALRVEFIPSPERAAQGTNITSVRERLGRCAEIVKVLPRSVPKSEQAPGGLMFALLLLSSADTAVIAEAAAVTPEALESIELLPNLAQESLPDEMDGDALDERSGHDIIRVDAARLDEVLERLGSLVVTRFKLGRALQRLRDQGADTREVQAIYADQGSEVRHLRAAITRARMVSATQLLERVPLIVRRLNASAHKNVRLEIEAGKSELDKTVADRIFPALVHLVRNAVDHAIEPAEERKRLGKPEVGTVTVRCREHSDTQLELSVIDDGRGIDAKALAQKANRALPTNEQELLELVTLTGLSARDEATERSGRGMGMDIVKRITDTLGGQLVLHSQAGVGTSFSLRIPLSISILDALSFKGGAETFVTPISMVEEIVEIREADVFSAPAAAQVKGAARLLNRRGEAIPLFRLTDLLRMETAYADLTVGLPSAIIVKRQGQLLAFAVDRMLSQQEVVIRPLEDPLVKVGYVSGTTDLGDGRPTLVLDLCALGHLGQTAKLEAGGFAREQDEVVA